MKNLWIIFSLMCLLAACSKEEDSLTRGEINGQKISSLTKDKNKSLLYVNIYMYNGNGYYLRESNQNYYISGQFLIVNHNYYDLNNLEMFVFENTYQLDVYFK